MQHAGPTLIIFHGGLGSGQAERILATARTAAARNTARVAVEAGFECVIFATDSPSAFAGMPPAMRVDADTAGQPFDFAQRLRSVVARFGLERPAVIGSGALPLMAVSDFRLIAEPLESHENAFVTNNFFSSDLCAWTPGSAIEKAGNFSRDNLLPRRLRDNCGLTPVILPRTTATQFDLDTPVDLAVLGLQESLSAELVQAVAPVTKLEQRLRSVMPVLCDRQGHLVVAGRVGSAAWQYMERHFRDLSASVGYIGRPADSCPAVGSHHIHAEQQAEILSRAFSQ